MYTVPLIVVVPWANPRLLNNAKRRNSSTIFFGIICLGLHAKPETERVERLDAFMQQVALPEPIYTRLPYSLQARHPAKRRQARPQILYRRYNDRDLLRWCKNGSDTLKRERQDQSGTIGVAGMGGRKATGAQRLPQRTPDFQSSSLALTHFMRVSVMKAARAGVGGACAGIRIRRSKMMEVVQRSLSLPQGLKPE
jgi:hypothetical protein